MSTLESAMAAIVSWYWKTDKFLINLNISESQRLEEFGRQLHPFCF